MTLKERLNEEMKAAAKSGDKPRLSLIRMIRSEVLNAEIEKQKELDDGMVLEVLSRMRKQHEDSITSFKQGNRPDLVAKEEAELKIIAEYMPAAMSASDVSNMIKAAIEKLEAKGPKDMGKVMAAIKGEYAGRADGKDVSAEVKKQLGEPEK